MDKNLEKKWLIKSENKILGPYHFDQIEDLIKKKQISLIDEVRDMETRWLYIRENTQFKPIVEEIRKSIDSKNDSTKTYQSFSKTATTTDTGQKTNANLPQFTEVDVQEASVVHETSQSEMPAVESFAETGTKKEKAKIYGLPQDHLFKTQVESSKKKIAVYILVFVVLLAGAAAAFNFYQKRSLRLQEEEWMAQIKKYQFLGFNQKAIDLYSKLPDLNQKKVLPEVLSLYPLLDSAHLVQLKEVEALQSNTDLSVEQKVNVQMIYFLSALQNQNLPVATETIVKARALQPASELVLENKALLDLKKRDFLTSYEGFLSLYKTDPLGRFLLGALQALSGFDADLKAKVTPQLSAAIEKHTSTYYDYKKELLLGQMALARWEKNEILFKVSWSQFLNTPVQFSNLFKKPLLLVPQSYQWKDLEEYKITVRSALQPEELPLFEIHNYLEDSQVSAANQYADNNLPKIKDKAVRQQMTLLILNSQSRQNEILALEKTNQLDMRSELNHILFALAKLDVNPQADISTHINYFKEHQLVFYADWIMLVQIIKKKDNTQIRPFLRDHLVTVNNFIPVIEARSVVE